MLIITLDADGRHISLHSFRPGYFDAHFRYLLNGYQATRLLKKPATPDEPAACRVNTTTHSKPTQSDDVVTDPSRDTASVPSSPASESVIDHAAIAGPLLSRINASEAIASSQSRRR
ncbi:hypothetical protein GQ600_13130 [Phytophthora cactorum]|nr:hypothetical protein GQ600_13130 [Phytophthora cactorum]